MINFFLALFRKRGLSLGYGLTVGWLVCLISALWIAKITGPAPSYDLSLSSAYPTIFWILSICSSIFSTLILINEAKNNPSKSKWWISGLLGIILTNILVISLPLIRGYPVLDRSDSMTHIGYVQDIINTGNIAKSDFYPGIHFLQLALVEIGGLQQGDAINVINIVAIILWSLGTGCFVYRLAENIGPVYLTFAFSAPLSLLTYHALANMPSTFSALIVPAMLALHFNRTRKNFNEVLVIIIAELIIAFLIVFLHPVTTLYVICLLTTLEVIRRGYIYFQNKKFIAISPLFSRSYSSIAVILVIVFFSWYFSFALLTQNFATAIKWIFGEHERDSAIQEAVAQVHTANLPYKTLYSILFNSFGVPLIVCGFVLGLSAFVVWLHFKKKTTLPYMYVCLVGLIFVATILIGGNFLISTPERYPIRLLRVLVILGLGCAGWWSWDLLFGPTFENLIKRSRTRVLLWEFFIFFFLSILIIMSQLNAYPNPRNGQPNGQVTRNELAGMKWLVYNRDKDTLQASILPDYYTRFEDYFKGATGRQDRPNWWYSDIWLPSHFYRKEWYCIAKITPDRETYLLLSMNGKIAPLRFPIEVRERAHIYEDQDWLTLAQDHSVDKIYDNGDFNVWVTRKDLSSCSADQEITGANK